MDETINATVGSPLPNAFGMTHELRKHWKWLLAIGILLVVLGMVALADSFAVTVASMIFFGWVLVIAGVVQAVQAFRHRQSGHLLLHTLNAVLSFVVGLLLISNPLAGALVATLLLAAYFTVAGIFRIVAGTRHVQGRAWIILSGAITLLLGIMIWFHWPSSALWIIGMFNGIDLLFSGWSQIMLAFALRQLPE
jgi:uncharacterized membrane protein HdeD (DUF308 family)